ncbi:FtsX-like permease family protein [Clostridium chrysemydis]|uniref:FtsX-like permease family protein n=1 Tax=Clostridium chrysemydis TaxID=2665504 RepID=UPI001884675F
MKNYTEISNRNFKINKRRNILTIIGITLATIIIFAIGTFILSTRDSLISKERENSNFEILYNDISSKSLFKIINNARVLDNYSISTKAISKSEDGKIDFLIKEYSNNAFNNIFSNEIVKGNLPKNSSEIIIENNIAKEQGYKINEEIKLRGGKEFKIVGFYKPFVTTNNNISNIYSLDNDKLDKDKKYDLYINLKDNKDAKIKAKKIGEEAGLSTKEINNIGFNEKLITLSSKDGLPKSMTRIAIIVIGLIMLSTITVIYNSFNLSIIERIREFGVLKAIGITGKQMKLILFKEGFLMCLIAIPLGIIIGYLSLVFLVNILVGSLGIINFKISIGFYKEIVFLTVIIVLLTVFISILGPARNVSKISAVNAIKNSNEYRKEKLKRRNAKLITKIFKIEGNIAYKNIKRTPKRFIVTVLALTISIIIFNVFTSLILEIKSEVKMMYGVSEFKAEVTAKEKDKNGLSKDVINYIYNTEGIENRLSFVSDYINLSLEKDKLTTRAKETFKIKDLNNGFVEPKQGVDVSSGNEEMFSFISKNSKEKYDLKEMVKNNEIILLDTTTYIKDKKRVFERLTNYKIGDTITFKDKDGNSKKFKIKDILNKNDINEGSQFFNIGIIMPKELYNKEFNDLDINGVLFSYNENLTDKEISNIEDRFMKNKDIKYMNIKEEVLNTLRIYDIMSLFVYSFIIIITLISVINIFNTIGTNVILRKREFSTLRGIGLTNKQLRKIVLLEGAFYGIFASIIGGIISLVLLKFTDSLFVVSVGIVETKSDFYKVIPFLISIFGSILITLLASVPPLNKLKKISIVEGLREED